MNFCWRHASCRMMHSFSYNFPSVPHTDAVPGCLGTACYTSEYKVGHNYSVHVSRTRIIVAIIISFPHPGSHLPSTAYSFADTHISLLRTDPSHKQSKSRTGSGRIRLKYTTKNQTEE